ncbi:hypothetical protein BJ508DRAFT_378184 [Ascobolus immersus RN42]|uniref:Uncharacterized protein n=1 Tax=Ascobolus immersus RN42 TaxID=1160509 RepID=A0A3N4HXZ0_ASCIM|nr:hypothetical protein BJ508DRAFT_378184 [Ascobolus immersus RN42]
MTASAIDRNVLPLLLSDEVHLSFLAYLHTLQHAPPTKTKHERNSDHLEYMYSLLHESSKYNCPPPFQALANDCLSFLMLELQPYCARLGMPLHCRQIRYDALNPRVEMISILRCFGLRTPFVNCDTVITKRWDNGLLRSAQVQLIHILVKKTLEQARACLRLEAKGNEEEVKYTELYRIICRCRVAMARFFTSPKFRSPRLERLLMKYLAEDDINWDVVRGTDRATRIVEGSRLDFWELGDFWRQKWLYHSEDLSNDDDSAFRFHCWDAEYVENTAS